MKKLLFCILLICLQYVAESQDSLSNELVKQHTYTLNIVGNRFTGEGWDALRKDMASSQFVLLGENHSSPKLSTLTSILLEQMKPLGYNHFIIETGPVTAEKLKQLFNKDINVFSKNLHDFLSAYKLEKGTPPAEFIAMPTDPLMYHAAITNGFAIKGIDKEYFAAYRYLLDELIPFCSDAELKKLQQRASLQVLRYDSISLADENFTRVLHIISDTIIQKFLTIMAAKPAAKFIVDQFKFSCEVYGLYERKEYYESERVRIAGLKKNFGDYYLANNKRPFKALIKYGNVHTERGESYYGMLDLGNTVSELAAMNGTRSLHIQGMRRYRYNDKDSIQDFATKGYEFYPHFISRAEKDHWVLVNLQPLLTLYKNGKLKLSKEERLLITKNDWLLLTPVDVAYSKSFNYE